MWNFTVSSCDRVHGVLTHVQVQTNGSKTPQQAVQTAIGSLEEELHDIRDKFQVVSYLSSSLSNLSAQQLLTVALCDISAFLVQPCPADR